jgi:hypothetical protein
MRFSLVLCLLSFSATLFGCTPILDDPDPDPVVDADEDGAPADVDCDDADPANFPGNAEVCDGADNDCDGLLGPDELDDDLDTFTECDLDCDDGEPLAFPGNPEICDGIDNDCDPATDETVDGDTDTITICDGDCDDTTADRTPGGAEVCDGVDNDCDDETGFSTLNMSEPDGTIEVRTGTPTAGEVRGNLYMVAEDVHLTSFSFQVTDDTTAQTAVVYSREDFDSPFQLEASAPLVAADSPEWRITDGLEITLTGERQWLLGVLSHGGTFDFQIEIDGSGVGWGHFAGGRGLNAAGSTPPDAFAPSWASAVVLALRTTSIGDDESDADDDGFVACDNDCDDDNDDAFPGGTEESCDLADNDCDPSTIDCDGGLVITEIFNNAFGSDEDREWFEVLNTTANDLDLRGFVVRDEDDVSFLVHRSTPVAAGGRAVFAQSSDFTANGGVIPDFEYTSLDLSNSEDELILVSGLGETVDAVHWDTAADFPAQEGASLNLDPTLTDAVSNDSGSSWCVTVSGPYGLGDEAGTPGEENGSCDLPTPAAIAGDIIVTEVMQNPTYVTDAHGEWFEIYNRSGVEIDLLGWRFGDDADDGFVVTGSLIIATGERLVFADNRDLSVNGYVQIDYRYGGNMGLGNDHDSIVIRPPDGLLEIDRIEWSGALGYPVPAGASMELDPSSHTLDGNDNGANWCVASADRGSYDSATPGEANDPCSI